MMIHIAENDIKIRLSGDDATAVPRVMSNQTSFCISKHILQSNP